MKESTYKAIIAKQDEYIKTLSELYTHDHYGMSPEQSMLCHRLVVDEISSLKAELEKEDEKLYVFLYNPMIAESSYATMSIHKTRKGAEMTMEFHKAEALKEFNEHVSKCDEEMKRFYKEESPFGTFEDWKVVEFEILT